MDLIYHLRPVNLFVKRNILEKVHKNLNAVDHQNGIEAVRFYQLPL
jgi:hypothetical protein